MDGLLQSVFEETASIRVAAIGAFPSAHPATAHQAANKDTHAMTSAARTAQAAQLLDLSLSAMLSKLKEDGSPSAEWLNAARLYLQALGAFSRASGDADRKRLESLYRLFVRKLTAALDVDKPSAAVFSETLKFLGAQGIGKDGGAPIKAAEAVRLLSSAALPFTAH